MYTTRKKIKKKKIKDSPPKKNYKRAKTTYITPIVHDGRVVVRHFIKSTVFPHTKVLLLPVHDVVPQDLHMLVSVTPRLFMQEAECMADFMQYCAEL